MSRSTFFQNRFGLDKSVADAYVESLATHIRYVREAGLRLGVPDEQLAVHDASKCWAVEFPAYARYHWARTHSLPLNGRVGNDFAHAWLHHIHRNQHHWQHWCFPDGFAPQGATEAEDGVLPMPERYALEMVADWLGAERAYTGSWNIAEWLTSAMPRIRLHSATAAYVRDVLASLGYARIARTTPFAHEAKRRG